MSIASEITRLQAAKADIKAAIENKGVTVPSAATLDEFSDYIDEISGGSGGIVITDTVDAAGGTIREITAQEISGTLSITQNGTYDVTQYASAEVNAKGEDLVSKKIRGLLTDYVGDLEGQSHVSFAMQNFRRLVNVRVINMGAGINTYFCDGCQELETAEFHFACTSASSPPNFGIGTGGFRNTPKLEKLVFHNAKQLWEPLTTSTAFTELVLDSAWIVAAKSVNIFNNPPAFKNGGTGGTIYIPKVMYDHLGDGSSLDYKAATNWSTFDSYGTITWAPIEGSWYETHYADGTLK